MVRLTRIYTRGGDGGETSLAGGDRVAKSDLRVAAFGTVDEANSHIGVARLHTAGGAGDDMLARIQNELFDLGADLATPAAAARRGGALRVMATQVARLEQEIDRMNAALPPLSSFILPGGCPAAAHLHVARSVVRRAERLTVALAARDTIGPEARQYLNRLSDHLFVLCRHLNSATENGADILWQPGATR